MHVLRFLITTFLLITINAQLQPNDTGRKCKPGTFDNGNLCLKCPLNSISSDEGSFQCNKCPEGLYSNKEGTECGETLGCRPGYFISNDRNYCGYCDIGTYSTTYNSLECISCPTNYTTRSWESTSKSDCFKCSKGNYMYNLPGDNKCASCGPGSYQDEVGHKVCKACPPGTGYILSFIDSTYLFQSSPDDCGLCPPGSYSQFIINTISGNSRTCRTCHKGTYTNIFGAVECKTCPEGTRSSKDRTYCFPDCDMSQPSCKKLSCPPGFERTNSSDNEVCKRCPKGKVSSSFTRTECFPCYKDRSLYSSGYGYNELVPHHSQKTCVCKNGKGFTTLYGEGKGVCEDCPYPNLPLQENGLCSCPKGRMLSKSGYSCICPVGMIERNGVCKQCEQNDLSNRGRCSVCTEGFSFSKKRNMCVPCASDKTTKGSNIATKCKPCTLFYINQAGKKKCGCKRGHHVINGTCKPCPRGYGGVWIPGPPGKNGCEKCKWQFYSNSTGLPKCLKCPKGRRFSQRSINFVCPMACPPRSKYNRGECECRPYHKYIEIRSKNRLIECKSCPENQVPNNSYSACRCKPGSVRVGDSCEKCPAGTFERNGKCLTCERNHISHRGMDKCKECEPNSFILRKGGTKCYTCKEGFFLSKRRKCRKCKKGFRVRNGECVRCDKNFFSDGGDIGHCTPCNEKLFDNKSECS